MASLPDGQGSTSPRDARLLADVQAALAGRYQVEGELGHGGMAVVFRAHNLNLDRAVAIKVMRPDKGYEEGVVDRFRTEAMAIAQLRHPNIIGVHARGEAGDILWFEMDLVDGGSLDKLICAKRLEPARAARFLADAAGALAYAHGKGVIHRDIKPSNLLVAAHADHLVVTDFGIAKILGTSTLTDAGMTVGTVAYMSPEQLRIGWQLTAATDQYSLGVVAYEMIAGGRPFTADTPVQFAVIQATRPLPPLRTRAPGCPADLARLIERMLAIAPEDRWPDLTVVKRAAEEIALIGAARSLGTVRRPARARRRTAWIVATAVAVATAMFWLRPVFRHLAAIGPVPPPALLQRHDTPTLPPPAPDARGSDVSAATGRAVPPKVGAKSAILRRDSNILVGASGPSRVLQPAPPADTPPPSVLAPPAMATLVMTTQTPGTFAYINDGTPIYLDGTVLSRSVAPGPLKLTVRKSGCLDLVLFDTLKAGATKRKRLNPACPN